MKKFSVLLLYPDYLAENFGQDTYFTHVEAEAPAVAVTTAQREAVHGMVDTCAEVDDFHPLLCIEGHHTDLAVQP